LRFGSFFDREAAAVPMIDVSIVRVPSARRLRPPQSESIDVPVARPLYRRDVTRYGRLAANDLAFVELASIKVWLRINRSAP